MFNLTGEKLLPGFTAEHNFCGGRIINPSFLCSSVSCDYSRRQGGALNMSRNPDESRSL